MGESKEKLIKAIKHYQDSLERHSKTANSEKLLHGIEKLSRLPIQVCHLEETGVGRTVNGLKRFEGSVGENARILVDKWKSMVKNEEDEEQARLEQEQARLQQEQEQDEIIENEVCFNEPEPESLKIVDQEEITVNDKSKNGETDNSSHRKSSSSNKYSRNNSRHSNRDKRVRSRSREYEKSRKTCSDDNSNSSISDNNAKKHKPLDSNDSDNSNSDKESASESESDESESSGKSSPRRVKDKKKSRRSSSDTSSGSGESCSENSSSEEANRKSGSKHHRNRDRKHIKHHSPASESDSDTKSSAKHNKYKNSISSHKKTDRDHRRSKEKHSESKDHSSKSKDKSKSNDHKSKSSDNKSSNKRDKDVDSRSKKDSSSSKTKSKSRETESKHRKSESDEKDKPKHGQHSERSSKSEDKKKEEESSKKNSKSNKEKERDEKDRKRGRDLSTDREAKRHKNEALESKDSKKKSHETSSSSKSREREAKEKKKSDDSKKEKGKRDKSDIENSKKSHHSSSSKSSKDIDKIKPQVTGTPKAKHSPKKLLEGIDSGSGTSFADVLGMLETPVYGKSKKKSSGGEEKHNPERSSSSSKEDRLSKSRDNAEESSSFKDNKEVPDLLADPGELAPLDINIASLLPSITPNYRPLGLPVENSNKKIWTDEEALTRVISAKHQRTKVFSGNRSSYTKVPSLFELCSRILQDNLDALEYTGGVPYSILKPILEKANPDQLYQLEFHNPYLIEDSDELWQLHCQKEFRNKKREEMESWREMYLRCLDEREAKLKALTANIKQSQDKSVPVRQTKLAYLDSVVKPPRNIARRQAKNGTAVDIKRPSQTPSERLSQLAKSGEAAKIAVPNPGRVAADRSSTSHSSHLKPKKAPLMAKTLSLLKNRFGRR